MAKKREAGDELTLGRYLAVSRGRTSVRRAAANVERVSGGAATLSEGRWRQVEAGYEARGGTRLPVNPKPETVVWMCLAVGADPRTGLELAHFDPDEYADLLQEGPPPATRSDNNPVREAIERDPRLGDTGRRNVLAWYDREVADEMARRRAV